MINTYFNFSFATSSLVPNFSSHVSSFLLIAALNTIFYHTFFMFVSSTLVEFHTSLALSTIVRFTYFHVCTTLLSSSYSTLSVSRNLVYPSLKWCSLSFWLLIFIAPFTTSLLLINTHKNLTLHCPSIMDITQHIFLYNRPIMVFTSTSSWLLATLVYLCKHLRWKYLLHTRSLLSPQKWITLLSLSFSPGTPTAPVMIIH